MMRVLFVNYEFPPVGGGAAYASLAMARELASLGHRVEFLTTNTPGTDEAAEIDGVHLHRVRSHRQGVHEAGLRGAFSFLCAAALRLPAISRQPHDLYHYYFGLPTGLLSRFPGRHQRRPYVISLRGSDVPGYDPQLAAYHTALLPVSRTIWRGAHRVVANSDALRKLALATAPDLSIDVISNGTDSLARHRRDSDWRCGMRVLTVSRLVGRKGLDTLIRAISRLHNERVSLDIAGDGPQRERLTEIARSCEVADRVRFCGFVDRTGLAALYSQADIFALSSLTESCSMALLEAMGAGLPIIATRVGGTTELVEHNWNGLLVRPNDVDELAGAIRELAHDAGQRERLGATNRALTQQRFSWRQVAKAYERVFEEAIGAYENSRRTAP